MAACQVRETPLMILLPALSNLIDQTRVSERLQVLMTVVVSNAARVDLERLKL